MTDKKNRYESLSDDDLLRHLSKVKHDLWELEQALSDHEDYPNPADDYMTDDDLREIAEMERELKKRGIRTDNG